VHGDIKEKLLVVDYFGATLTLGGCTLILLPLIWVCDLFSKYATYVCTDMIMTGWSNVFMDFDACPCNSFKWHYRHGDFLSLGMERRHTSNCTMYASSWDAVNTSLTLFC